MKGVFLVQIDENIQDFELIEVESSNIKKIKYLFKSKSMVVEFNNSIKYEYFDVTYDLFNSIAKSTSVGKAFDSIIRKGNFRYSKVV